MWGKIQFNCGQYAAANTALHYYIMLSENEERRDFASWGKFAAGILQGLEVMGDEDEETLVDEEDIQRWNEQLADLESLKALIDSKVSISTRIAEKLA